MDLVPGRTAGSGSGALAKIGGDLNEIRMEAMVAQFELENDLHQIEIKVMDLNRAIPSSSLSISCHSSEIRSQHIFNRGIGVQIEVKWIHG